MTMTQKILANHINSAHLDPGEFIEVPIDMILANDITAPVAIKAFRECNINNVFDKTKIALVMDHFTPNKDIKAANQCNIVRQFAKEQNIEHFFDVGDMGIEHALLPEKGLVAPGDCIIGADSHTCTYGALGAFSTGVGSTDMAVAMITGKVWLKVPQAIKIELTGKPNKWVSGKDIILSIIGTIGEDGAMYKSIEFGGDGIANLNIDDRFCISNMVIEAGAKNGIFPIDEITRRYINGRCNKVPIEYSFDEDANYDQTYKIDLSMLEPIVALPHSPQNISLVSKIKKTYIDQVVIGSCTNGRMSDMRIAAQILKNKKVAKNVRCIIIPATQQIYLESIKEGLAETFINAGAVISTPTCGPCLGGHMGILGDGEVCLSTTNRNFVGRMGHINSKVYLSSPAVAASSAITGYITSPL